MYFLNLKHVRYRKTRLIHLFLLISFRFPPFFIAFSAFALLTFRLLASTFPLALILVRRLRMQNHNLRICIHRLRMSGRSLHIELAVAQKRKRRRREGGMRKEAIILLVPSHPHSRR